MSYSSRESRCFVAKYVSMQVLVPLYADALFQAIDRSNQRSLFDPM